MVLGPAYRGHAPVTFDTVTAQAIVDEVNAHTGNAGIHGAGAGAYFLDVDNGDGTGVVTALSNVSWQTINVGGTVRANPGGGWDSGTDIYTTPVAGVYFCQALVRMHEGFGTSTNVGIGIHTSNDDFSGFQWNKYTTGGGGRCSFDYTRIASFPAGAPLRLYAWQESGTVMNVTRASLQIFKVA